MGLDIGNFLGGGVSDSFKNFGTQMFGSNLNPPGYAPPSLTQGTQDAISNVNNQANTLPSTLNKEILQGTDSYKGFLPSSQSMGQQESSLGMQSTSAQREALANKGGRAYNQALSSLSRQSPEMANQWAMQREMAANKILMERDKWTFNVAGAEIQSVLNQQAARAAVVGSITGAAGAIIGGIFGGAAGAKGGAKAGASAAPGSGASSTEGDIGNDYYDIG